MNAISQGRKLDNAEVLADTVIERVLQQKQNTDTCSE